MSRKNIISTIMTVLVFGFVLILSIYYLSKSEVHYLQGEVEATQINLASKVPGRVKDIYVNEGDQTQVGELLLELETTEINAKMDQAKAAREAALAQSNKAKSGARTQQIEAAYDLWQQAKVAADFAEQTYDKVNRLYQEDVVPEQKRNEAFTKMKAMKNQERAAYAQYSMAKSGARIEDKQAANALVMKADGAIAEVTAYQEGAKVQSPYDAYVQQIIPNKGEIVNAGYPIVILVDLKEIWVVFNIREDKLNQYRVGNKFKAMVPALGNKEIELEVKFMAPLGDFATWNTTQASGDFDKKTFKIKAYPTKKVDGLRPGMSVLAISDK